MKIAINGCGIAGPTFAWWLEKYGYEPIIFEQSPALRTGGHIIDFWGTGYDIAEKMGLFPALMDDAYIMKHLRTVMANGRTSSSLDAQAMQELTNNRYLSIARSDLSRHLFNACSNVETRFGSSIVGIDDRGDKVEVQLNDGKREQFDLVFGADGLHSKVRQLTFGPQGQFENHCGMYVAAFTLSGYAHREELTYISYTNPHRQVSRVSLRDDKTLILFIFSADYVSSEPQNDVEKKALLREIFGDMKWEASEILACMDDVSEIYLDRVSQIKIENWSKGRVALLGDAAACASLLAGEGTGLAMTEAFILAGELHRADGNHRAAFQAYHDKLHSYLNTKQQTALKFAGFFAPKSWVSLIARDVLTNLVSIPGLTKLIMGGTFKSDLELPEYK